MAGSSTIKVSVVEGPDAPLSLVSRGDEIVIGRLGTCDLSLTDSQVSRQHAKIQREGDGFVLVDLESANGTFIGDQRERVTRHALDDGASFRIGHDVLRVSITRDSDRTQLAPTRDPEGTVTAVLSQPEVPAAIEITVLSGPDQGRSFRSDHDQVRIGRLGTCEVQLADRGISRLHATIRREAFGYAIYDENSTNGVEIGNPAKRVFFARLEDGMVLRMSTTDVRVKFVYDAKAAEPAAPARDPEATVAVPKPGFERS